MELRDYNDFNNFFVKNKSASSAKFEDLVGEFREVFDGILARAKLQKDRPENHAIAIALYLRALKYLFTIQQLTLEGHVEEARILKRSVLEALLLGYLVEHSVEVFELWKECFGERVENTSGNGVVVVPKFRKKKYEINQIIKQNRNILSQDPVISPLIRSRGEFSTYFSHENIYNIVPRVENASTDDLGKIELYIGQSAKSKNDRTYKSLLQNMELLKIVDELVK